VKHRAKLARVTHICRLADSERRVIATTAKMTTNLRALGLTAGDTVCVHSSVKALGNVIGGPRAIIDALIAAVSPRGTIMMPAFSGDLSDPVEWRHPPAPADRLDEIRDQLPAFDKLRTPSRGLGLVAEYFRTYPGVLRSDHPQSSFTALGSQAKTLTAGHGLDNRFGPQSPLGRLVDVAGKVLLLGAPHDTASLFHLTQHLVGVYPTIYKAAPMMVKGECQWVVYRDIDYPIEWFDSGMESLLTARIAVSGPVCAAPSILFSANESVEHLVEWRKFNGFDPP